MMQRPGDKGDPVYLSNLQWARLCVCVCVWSRRDKRKRGVTGNDELGVK